MALVTPEQGQATDHAKANGGKPATPVRSFTASSDEHVEPAGIDVSSVLTANAQGLGPFDVPAVGYLRGIAVIVEATGGAGGAAVAKADAPWSVVQSVQLSDVNGQPMFGPYTGYEWYLVNLLGGYDFMPDPTKCADYTAVDANGNFSFILRVPVEITSRDALGALANMNSSAAYRLSVTLAPSTDVYGTPPATTLPTVRVRGYVEAWTQPAAVGLDGLPNTVQPPALGTTQYWSKQVINAAAGQQTWRLARVGNAIRNLVFVTRDATGARVSTIWPDPATLNVDGRQREMLPVKLSGHYLQTRYGIAAIPAGVYVWDYTHDFDGHPGGELRDLWLRTTAATRLEVTGTAGAAGTVTALTNDVASFAGSGV